MSFQIRAGQGYIRFRLERALKDRRLYKDLAEFMRNRIYQSTKRGRYGGVRKNLAKFRPLSEGYVKERRAAFNGEKKKFKQGIFGNRLSNKQKTAKAKKKFGAFFSPKRSNLTYTGEMLEALEGQYQARQQQVGVRVKNSPRRDGSGLTNREVAIKVNAEGRPFPTIDSKGINTMVRKIQQTIRRKLGGRGRRR